MRVLGCKGWLPQYKTGGVNNSTGLFLFFGVRRALNYQQRSRAGSGVLNSY